MTANVARTIGNIRDICDLTCRGVMSRILRFKSTALLSLSYNYSGNMKKISIDNDVLTYTDKFRLRRRKINFKVIPVPNGENPVIWLKNAIEQAQLQVSEKEIR